MNKAMLDHQVHRDTEVSKVFLAPGVAKEKLVQLVTEVSKDLEVIQSLNPEEKVPVDSKVLVVPRDLWDIQAIRVLLGLQDVKVIRVQLGLWGHLAHQVPLDLMVLLDSQEKVVSKDLLDLKVPQVYLVIQVIQDIGEQ